MIESEVSLPVRYYETDQMGIVHHSNYVRYFECARDGLLRDNGYPIERCEADGVTIPIVSVQIKYHHPAKMGDVVRCVARVERTPLAKLFVRQAVYNQEGELCADGEVVLGFLDKVSGKPVRCPRQIVEIIENGGAK